MKNSFSLILLSAFMLLTYSCGLSSSPKKSAERFLNSFNDRDFKEARKYATPETIKLVDLMENLTTMAQSTDTIVPGAIEILEEKIDGETATVTFKEEGSEEIQELKLKKIDGKWLVHVTKEDIAAKDINSDAGSEEGFWSDDDTLDLEADTLLTE